MISVARPPGFPLFVAIIATLLACTAPARSEEQASPPEPLTGSQFPPDLVAECDGTISQLGDDGVLFDGPVTMTWRDSRFQADRIELRERRYVEAEGNVLIVWGRNRIFGSRMTYDLETERGVIDNAIGHALDEYYFWADSVEKIGPDKLRLRRATVTTCTQPVPYWSFRVSRATITIDKYARMRNVRFKAGRTPIIYLPYLVWPVKDGRAAGLLFPEFGSTQARGRAITQELFIPLGRSADVTLLGRYYSKAGFGGGGELRWVPNAEGDVSLRGFYIEDDLLGGVGRYRADYRQTQKFDNGFRMVADGKLVSDSSYFADFEKDLNEIASPEILTRVEFTRNASWTSLNIREQRREQVQAVQGTHPADKGLVQQTLPEIEWRGRSRQLGKTPLYLEFESSLASIQQKDIQLVTSPDPNDSSQTITETFVLDADYLRGDIAPVFSVPLSPAPWFDITPRVGYRITHYTQQQQQLKDGAVRVQVDDSLDRQLWSYGVDLVGPKLYRIFRSQGEPAYKHTLETRVGYGFAEDFDKTDRILRYDQVDGVPGGGEQMTLAFVQRLFGKKPRSPEPVEDEDENDVAGESSATGERSAATQGAQEGGTPPPQEPVEIASLQLSMNRSFDRELNSFDLDPDPMVDDIKSSRSSPISIVGRVNPRPGLSVDLRSRYDTLLDGFSDLSLSGNLAVRRFRSSFSLNRNFGLGLAEGRTDVRLTGDVNLFRDKLRLSFDGSYTTDAQSSSSFPDRRWQLRYTTQCCMFVLERIDYLFSSIPDRQELSLRVDLQGVGKVLSQTFE